MNGSEGLQALAALCGGEAAVATSTDNSKSQTGNNSHNQHSHDGSSVGSNMTSTTGGTSQSTQPSLVSTGQPAPEGITQRQWQQAVAAAAALGAPQPANNGGAPQGLTAQSLAILQAAGLQAPQAQQQQQQQQQAQKQQPNSDLAAAMQQLAYFRHFQEQTQQNASAAANMNLLYSNPVAMALAGQQLQQHLGNTAAATQGGMDAAARQQQVLPPAPTSVPSKPVSAKTEQSSAAQSMPPPSSSVASTKLSTAGITNSGTRHTAIAPLPNNAHQSHTSETASLAHSQSSEGEYTGGGNKKLQKRAANRRSAQLSRKRKKQFIEELKDENDELRRKEQILRSIPDLIVVFDSTGKLWFVSQSVSRFVNMSAKELEGTSFWDRLCEDSVRLLKAAFMDSLAARTDDSDTAPLGSGIWELRLVDKDGSHKVVTLNGVVHFSGDRPECVCSIRPRDDPSMLPKRKQRKSVEAAATEDAKNSSNPGVVSVTTSNGSDGTVTASSENDMGGMRAPRFQPLIRADPQQSVIASASKVKAAEAAIVNGKHREAARISDGDSGSTDTDSGSSDELMEETTA